MEKSTVYFTDFRCKVGTSQLDKLKKLCIAAGIKDIDMDGKFVAIKMHFGELGNLAFLRPNYAKVVADLCKELGGMPFLTDCNTLYPGSRKNALEHMDCANLNGFNTITTGCQIIIGSRDMKPPVSAAQSRILVWAAEAVPEKWLSTIVVNQLSKQTFAAAANVAQRNAEVTLLHIRRKKRSLIMINARAAAVVSVPAVLMQFTTRTAIPMSFSAVR